MDKMLFHTNNGHKEQRSILLEDALAHIWPGEKLWNFWRLHTVLTQLFEQEPSTVVRFPFGTLAQILEEEQT